MQALRAAAIEPGNAEARVQDMAFVLEQLVSLRLEKHGWTEKMDMDHIGIAGHSFGSMTTLIVAGRGFAESPLSASPDSRIKAALAMSSPIPKARERQEAEFGCVQIPTLHMTGTEDVIPISTTRPEERRIPFDCAHLAPAYLVNFQGGDHMVFAGMTRNAARQEKDQFIHAVIQDSSLALWDAWLKQDAKAREWLEKGGLSNCVGEHGRVEIK
jgi:predicted dienelactone hydrolase